MKYCYYFCLLTVGPLAAGHGDVEGAGQVAQLLHQPQPRADHGVHLVRGVPAHSPCHTAHTQASLLLDMSVVGGCPLPLPPEPLVAVLGGDVPGVPAVPHPGQPAAPQLAGPHRGLGPLQEVREVRVLAEDLQREGLQS